MKQKEALTLYKDDLEYAHSSMYGTYMVPVERLKEYSIESQTAKIVFVDPILEEETVRTVKFSQLAFTSEVFTDPITETSVEKTYWLDQLPQK